MYRKAGRIWRKIYGKGEGKTSDKKKALCRNRRPSNDCLPYEKLIKIFFEPAPGLVSLRPSFKPHRFKNSRQRFEFRITLSLSPHPSKKQELLPEYTRVRLPEIYIIFKIYINLFLHFLHFYASFSSFAPYLSAISE